MPEIEWGLGSPSTRDLCFEISTLNKQAKNGWNCMIKTV